MESVLSDKERESMDAYWRAANYVSIGQIYLYDNPLLKESLTKEQAAAPGPLGDHAGFELYLRSPEPTDQNA